MEKRVVVTGHQGYIGSVLVPLLRDAGYTVRGIDAGWYAGCNFGDWRPATPDEELLLDIRDIEPRDLEDAAAVIHLAALSNDPLGKLDAGLTWAINHEGTVRVAEAARKAGVERFVFSSSCSLYGAADEWQIVDESAPSRAVTAYGETKIAAERDLSALAGPNFSPTFLRNATAYGPSPRLRGDLVVNEFVAYATLDRPIEIRSDGSPWRPLVHVADIARAFIATLSAPRDAIHDRAFNVGANHENFRVRDIARAVAGEIRSATVKILGAGTADSRSYRVDFTRIERELEAWKPEHRLSGSIGELGAEYRLRGISLGDLHGPRHTRVRKVLDLREEGKLDHSLRWRRSVLQEA